MRVKKFKKRIERYIPLTDIEKINTAFLNEMERVKLRLSNVQDKAIIEAFHNVLLSAYNAAIEMQTLEREVDYDIKLTEIEQRRRARKPWRRCWLWRLLFRPLTNRAQDIIEERAELDADFVHTAAEVAIDNDRKKLLSKREIENRLKEIIKRADNADTNEIFTEPAKHDDSQEGAETPARTKDVQTDPRAANTTATAAAEPKSAEQLPGQITLDEVQKQLPTAQTRRPRTPRSCRKPATPGQ